jgi:hypothetical protein
MKNSETILQRCLTGKACSSDYTLVNYETNLSFSYQVSSQNKAYANVIKNNISAMSSFG